MAFYLKSLNEIKLPPFKQNIVADYLLAHLVLALVSFARRLYLPYRMVQFISENIDSYHPMVLIASRQAAEIAKKR